MDSGRGTTILVYGILGLVLCGLFTAIPAWVMGEKALADIRAGRLDPSEQGICAAGRTLGVIGSLLHGCLYCFLLFPILIGLACNASPHPRLDFDPAGPAIQKMQQDTARSNAAQSNIERILDAVSIERKRHPDKSYAELAQELRDARRKPLNWFGGSLKPPDGCGEYKFEATKRCLRVSNGCGDTTLSDGAPDRQIKDPTHGGE